MSEVTWIRLNFYQEYHKSVNVSDKELGKKYRKLLVDLITKNESSENYHLLLEAELRAQKQTETAIRASKARWERERANASSNAPSIPESNASSNATRDDTYETIHTPPTPKSKKIKETIEIPLELLSIPFFESAWSDWLEHLKEKKKNPTSKAIELQFKKLLSVSDPVGMINHSIGNNWIGLFEPSNSFQQKKVEPELSLDQYAHRAGAEAFKKMKSNVDDAGW